MQWIWCTCTIIVRAWHCNDSTWLQACRKDTGFSRIARPHAVRRCGLLLHMSHVAWSVCMCVCWTHRWAVQNGWTDRDEVYGADSCESNKPCTEGRQAVVTYLSGTSAFVTARNDKTCKVNANDCKAGCNYKGGDSALCQITFDTCYFTPSPPIDRIWAVILVWRLRGKIIRTALCCVVY